MAGIQFSIQKKAGTFQRVRNLNDYFVGLLEIELL
jgi:hypothetical protein